MMKTVEYYMTLPYRMEIIPESEEGGYTVCFPELPGCITSSETLDDIVNNANDAKKAWFEAALDDDIDIPIPGSEYSLSAYSGQFKIRMPKSLHRDLSIQAKKEGISMNQYCIYLLSKFNIAKVK